ncbi:MAG TPA: efflux RND transporter periplasmic adaptor subunit [Anaerolineales bacterium]|nr:efflux RND transporter periplasmic adaptor subunit [Anaerolineales bacterium]
MKHKHYLPFFVLIVVLITAGAWWIRAQAASTSTRDSLEATGVIETQQVALANEIGGKIAEVLVEEGQPVKANQPLVRLDTSLLTAQRQVTQRGVDSAQTARLAAQNAYDLAQAQYDATVTTARAQQGAARLTDWLGRAPSQFNQHLWYFSQGEQITAAQVEVDSSQKALEQAQADLDQVVKSLNNADFVNAETRLSNARVSYLVAKTVRDQARATGGKVRPEDISLPDMPAFAPAYRIKINIAKKLSSESGEVNTSAQDALDAVEAELDDAQQAYDGLLNTDAADRVLKARAAVSVARERHEVALDTLHRLQEGEYSPQVKIASISLERAKTGLQQAQNTVDEAEASLALLDTQMKKLTVHTPMDGVVLTRSAEVGQVALPGATLIEIGRLDELELTVYLPEEKFGLVVPDQTVKVHVDAYPANVFEGKVIRMANEAEFTPTNVQTKEDRTRLVYAVVIKLDNPGLELKPGMIADVEFTK